MAVRLLLCGAGRTGLFYTGMGAPATVRWNGRRAVGGTRPGRRRGRRRRHRRRVSRALITSSVSRERGGPPFRSAYVWAASGAIGDRAVLAASPSPRTRRDKCRRRRLSRRIGLCRGGTAAPGPRSGAHPAHTAVEVGESVGLLFAVDALLHPLQARRPDWGHGLDHDVDAAVATRRTLLARAADRGHVIAASHWDDVVAP